MVDMKLNTEDLLRLLFARMDGKCYTIVVEQTAVEVAGRVSSEIAVGELIDTIEYDYPDFHLSMDCFWCTVVDGEIILKEAEASKWLNKDELYTVDWLPADISLIEKLQNSLLM